MGRAAAANPASKPIPPQVQPEPVVVETTQDVPSTSSKGKLIDTFYPALFNKLILKNSGVAIVPPPSFYSGAVW